MKTRPDPHKGPPQEGGFVALVAAVLPLKTQSGNSFDLDQQDTCACLLPLLPLQKITSHMCVCVHARTCERLLIYKSNKGNIYIKSPAVTRWSLLPLAFSNGNTCGNRTPRPTRWPSFVLLPWYGNTCLASPTERPPRGCTASRGGQLW